MKIDLNNIEFDMNEFGALLLQDKQEGFRQIGEKLYYPKKNKQLFLKFNSQKSKIRQ